LQFSSSTKDISTDPNQEEALKDNELVHFKPLVGKTQGTNVPYSLRHIALDQT
jgi:hypothetical protein